MTLLRTSAFLALTMLVGTGCSLVQADVPREGRALVAVGVEGGLNWRVTHDIEGDRDCLYVTFPGFSEGSGGSCGVGRLEPGRHISIGSTGESGEGGGVTVFRGFASPDVANVRIRTRDDGIKTVAPVPLPHGNGDAAYAAGFPAVSRLLSIEALDAQGVVIDTHNAP